MDRNWNTWSRTSFPEHGCRWTSPPPAALQWTATGASLSSRPNRSSRGKRLWRCGLTTKRKRSTMGRSSQPSKKRATSPTAWTGTPSQGGLMIRSSQRSGGLDSWWPTSPTEVEVCAGACTTRQGSPMAWGLRSSFAAAKAPNPILTPASTITSCGRMRMTYGRGCWPGFGRIRTYMRPRPAQTQPVPHKTPPPSA